MQMLHIFNGPTPAIIINMGISLEFATVIKSHVYENQMCFRKIRFNWKYSTAYIVIHSEFLNLISNWKLHLHSHDMHRLYIVVLIQIIKYESTKLDCI